MQTKRTVALDHGIESLLADLKVGGKTKVNINFRNNTLSKLAEMHSKTTAKEFTEKQLLELARNNSESSDFAQAIVAIARMNVKSKGINLEEEIQKQYFQIRNLPDTLLILFRMLRVGIIDDYEIDFKYNTIEIHLTKKSELAYKKAYNQYLKLFVERKEIESPLNVGNR